MHVVADRPHHRKRLDLVGALDRPRLHHRRHPIRPLDPPGSERPHQVDVDEIHPQRPVRHPGVLQVVHQGVHELVHLLLRRRTHRPLDPDIRMADVLFRDPRIVHLQMQTDIALLIHDRRLTRRQHHIPQPRLETIPPRRQRRRHIPHVLVIEQQQGPQPRRLHRRMRPLQPPLTHRRPIDPLLPIRRQHPKRFPHALAPYDSGRRFSSPRGTGSPRSCIIYDLAGGGAGPARGRPRPWPGAAASPDAPPRRGRGRRGWR